MIQLRTQNDIERLAQALRPVIDEVVYEQRVWQREQQQRRRAAAQKYQKRQKAEQARKRFAAMSDQEREASFKADAMRTMIATAQTYAKAQAVRDESARIKAEMQQPLAVKARELCLASREAGQPMTYDAALRLVTIRSKERYSKPKSEAQLLQAAQKYADKQRKAGRNMQIMTALKHVKLGLS